MGKNSLEKRGGSAGKEEEVDGLKLEKKLGKKNRTPLAGDPALKKRKKKQKKKRKNKEKIQKKKKRRKTSTNKKEKKKTGKKRKKKNDEPTSSPFEPKAANISGKREKIAHEDQDHYQGGATDFGGGEQLLNLQGGVMCNGGEGRGEINEGGKRSIK